MSSPFFVATRQHCGQRCGVEAGMLFIDRPANRRSVSQIFRQNDTPKCAAACRDSVRKKFCTADMRTRADFAIGRLTGPPFDPLTNSAPAIAPPLPDVQCKKAQYQCDDLHACNIFTVSAISVPASSRFLRSACTVPVMRDDAPHRTEWGC
jgi:hypothetical protein